jgi:hypothetical protein
VVRIHVGAFPPLAQLGEQWTVVPRVIRSIRIGGIHSSIAQLVERATVNREVIGSNPVGREISTHSSVVRACA